MTATTTNRIAKFKKAREALNGAPKREPETFELGGDETGDETGAGAKPEKKGGKKKTAEKIEKEQTAPKGGAKKNKGDDKPAEAKPEEQKKQPGIIDTILECLTKASKDKPITKKAIFDVLKAKFPDRSETSMMSTVNHQVPTYLTYAGHKVVRVEGGYYAVAKKAE